MFGSVIISPYLCNVKFKVQPAMANGNIIIGELGSGDAPRYKHFEPDSSPIYF